MTAHELARLLLAGPDQDVAHLWEGEIVPIRKVWLSVPRRPDGRMLNTSMLDTAAEVADAAAAPKVTILWNHDCPACSWDGNDEHAPGCPVTRAEVPRV